jgi:hypothetical protein
MFKSKALARKRARRHRVEMRTVEQIQSDIRQLSVEDMRRVRDYLDDLVEDELEFTPEFEAQIRQSEEEMKSGVRPRVRKP